MRGAHRFSQLEDLCADRCIERAAKPWKRALWFPVVADELRKLYGFVEQHGCGP